jgi:hypothetical protein
VEKGCVGEIFFGEIKKQQISSTTKNLSKVAKVKKVSLEL